MMDGGSMPDAPYPGASASAPQILQYANTYFEMAEWLYAPPKPRPALWHAPFRLCALQSIELYLQAFLRFRGAKPEDIRSRHHDVWHEEFTLALALRQSTCENLKSISANREYLKVRYAPDLVADWSPPSRIKATLKEINDKRDRIPFAI